MKVKPQKGMLGLCSFISDVSNFSLNQTLVFLFLRVFWCGPLLKSIYWVCYNIASVVYVLVFLTLRHVGSQLHDQPGIKFTPPALEREVLTTAPPGKSPDTSFWMMDEYSLNFLYNVMATDTKLSSVLFTFFHYFFKFKLRYELQFFFPFDLFCHTYVFHFIFSFKASGFWVAIRNISPLPRL